MVKTWPGCPIVEIRPVERLTDPATTELARVVRDHAGRLAAALVRLTGDFAAAEDLVQDAVLAALEHWPVEGIPDRPDAWLFTVARRRGLDQLRRADNYRAKLAELRPPAAGGGGRAAAADLHLLPPGAAADRADRADAAGGVRADHGPDRARRSWSRRPRWRSGSPGPSGRSPTPASRTGSRTPTSSATG